MKIKISENWKFWDAVNAFDFGGGEVTFHHMKTHDKSLNGGENTANKWGPYSSVLKTPLLFENTMCRWLTSYHMLNEKLRLYQRFIYT